MFREYVIFKEKRSFLHTTTRIEGARSLRIPGRSESEENALQGE
jgi:hypothetical protein